VQQPKKRYRTTPAPGQLPGWSGWGSMNAGADGTGALVVRPLDASRLFVVSLLTEKGT